MIIIIIVFDNIHDDLEFQAEDVQNDDARHYEEGDGLHNGDNVCDHSLYWYLWKQSWSWSRSLTKPRFLFYFHKLFAFLFLQTQMIFEIKSLSRPIHVLCVSFTQLILGQFWCFLGGKWILFGPTHVPPTHPFIKQRSNKTYSCFVAIFCGQLILGVNLDAPSNSNFASRSEVDKVSEAFKHLKSCTFNTVWILIAVWY